MLNTEEAFLWMRSAVQKEPRVNPELIWGHIHQMVGIRHADTNPSGLEKALGYLAETYTRYGLQIREEVFDPFGVKYPNLIGVLPGKDQADEVLIIGAHYDTVAISPGADDNASGLAVMLETARVLSGLPPGCGVEFVGFSMEEQGLLGSCSYAYRARRSGKKILGAVVLESVGYTEQRPGSQRIPPGLPISVPEVGNFMGIVGNTASADLCRAFEETITAHVPRLPKLSFLVPGNGEAFPDTRRSDHASFWDVGLPALMITDTADFRNPHYHQATDLPETLDITFMTELAQALVAFALSHKSFLRG